MPRLIQFMHFVSFCSHVVLILKFLPGKSSLRATLSRHHEAQGSDQPVHMMVVAWKTKLKAIKGKQGQAHASPGSSDIVRIRKHREKKYEQMRNDEKRMEKSEALEILRSRQALTLLTGFTLFHCALGYAIGQCIASSATTLNVEVASFETPEMMGCFGMNHAILQLLLVCLSSTYLVTF